MERLLHPLTSHCYQVLSQWNPWCPQQYHPRLKILTRYLINVPSAFAIMRGVTRLSLLAMVTALTPSIKNASSNGSSKCKMARLALVADERL
mmetsp:Transcript_7751/g.17499  ORF Transcript_7751/g.17499 Transcript_7751/m.17499 type:complete len:92 (-) Transcript_7751:174-449(-)